MDQEEFEFKPLTEGLGFHRKADQMKTEPAVSRLASEHVGRMLPAPTPSAQPRPEVKKANVYENISKLMESMPASVDFAESKSELSAPREKKSETVIGPLLTSSLASTPTQPKVFQPLTGPGLGAKPVQTKTADLPAPGTPAHPVQTPQKKKSRISEVLTPSIKKSAAPVAGIAIPMPPIAVRKERNVELNLPAILIDTMVVAGVSILCLVCILLVTNVNLIGLLSHARTEGSTRLDLTLLLLFVLQFYMLASRSFFGATLGEWAFDQQLGTDEQLKRGIYPYQVLLRSLVVTLTGMILLPLLSAITQIDILHKISGLKHRSTLKTAL